MMYKSRQQHLSVIPAVESMPRTPIRGRNPEVRVVPHLIRYTWNRYWNDTRPPILFDTEFGYIVCFETGCNPGGNVAQR